MTTLTVTVDAQWKRKYKLNKQRIGFEKLRQMILRSERLQALRRTTKIASQRHLKKMTTREIDREISAVRRGNNRS